MIKAKEVENEILLCLFANYKKMESTFGKRYAYFCQHCKKVLGVTHRKGFWMG